MELAMYLIDKLLSKRGIEKVEDLSQEEQKQIQQWKVVLSGETVTVDSIKEFCESQIKIIETKFASESGTFDQNVFLKACLHVYLNLLRVIDAPKAERESLERQLVQIINS